MLELYTNASRTILERGNDIDPQLEGSGSIVEDVACKWLQENKEVWESWEPKGGNGKIPLYIGGIFPISGSYTERGIVIGGYKDKH